jgi:hypothetical protein
MPVGGFLSGVGAYALIACLTVITTVLLQRATCWPCQMICDAKGQNPAQDPGVCHIRCILIVAIVQLLWLLQPRQLQGGAVNGSEIVTDL